MKTWVLESEVFPICHARLRAAIHDAGDRVVDWRDEWPETGYPRLDGEVIFHGSLGAAARIARDRPWQPGAYCAVEKFHFSAYAPGARRWLLNASWELATVADLPRLIAAHRSLARLFVRPDGPLKAFGGRVVAVEQLTPAALDFGYYYDDTALPIVISEARAIGREFRFVISDRRVVTGSGYQAGHAGSLDGAPLDFVAEIAAALDPPEHIYVADVCETSDGPRLIELNPFSGADLYACDARKIVAVEIASRALGP